MYISKVIITGFRNFYEDVNIPLKPFTILLGLNDSGKSNVLDAIDLVLYSPYIDYYNRRPKLHDFNNEAILKMRKFITSNKSIILASKSIDDVEGFSDIIPVIKIVIQISDAIKIEEKALIRHILTKDMEFGELIYMFNCNKDKFFDYIKTNLEHNVDINHIDIPIQYYNSETCSPSGRAITHETFKSFNSSLIRANRDDFASNDNASSSKLINKSIISGLTEADIIDIESKYKEFFTSIKSTSNATMFIKNLKENTTINNISDFVKDVELMPLIPKTETIFSNIRIGYGSEQLFQKGLGTRNLILLLILYANVISKSTQVFNLIAVEEPEAHLSINNEILLNDILSKSFQSIEENRRNQLLITTHSSQTINKIGLDKVVIMNGKKFIDLSTLDEYLLKYLKKHPNFDILRLLFSKKVILVEGVTEEIFLNTLKEIRSDISDVDVIVIGRRGFKSFMKLWSTINTGTDKKLGVIADFDFKPNAKKEHQELCNDNINVSFTKHYNFEPELYKTGQNNKILDGLITWDFEEREMLDDDNETYVAYKLTTSPDKAKLIDEISDLMLEKNKNNKYKNNVAVPAYIEKLLKWINQ